MPKSRLLTVETVAVRAQPLSSKAYPASCVDFGGAARTQAFFISNRQAGDLADGAAIAAEASEASINPMKICFPFMGL